MDLTIDRMTDSDADAVIDIYDQGISSGNATFETKAPVWESWNSSHLAHSRLVARSGAEVIGWAALSSVSDRCIYGGVAEVSVYVATAGRGRGVGKALLRALIESSEKNNIWTLQAGVFPENSASIRLHLQNGFREVGRRERIGKHHGIWRDTILLERRSSVI